MLDRMIPWSRVRQALGSRPQAELCRLMALSPQVISNWKRAGGAPSNRASDLARALDVSTDWLLFGDRGRSDGINAEQYALIPLCSALAECGDGSPDAGEDIETHLAFRRDWLRGAGIDPDHAAALHIVGESMTPTLCHGDVVLVNTAQITPINGRVFVIRAPDGLRVKRLFRSVTGEWRLTSDSHDKAKYPDEAVTDAAALRLVGCCAWRGGAI